MAPLVNKLSLLFNGAVAFFFEASPVPPSTVRFGDTVHQLTGRYQTLLVNDRLQRVEVIVQAPAFSIGSLESGGHRNDWQSERWSVGFFIASIATCALNRSSYRFLRDMV